VTGLNHPARRKDPDMPKARATITIEAPVDTVFAYVNEWTNAQKFTQDLVKWEPVGDNTTGLGAQFRAAMKMGPTTQESTLEITQHEPGSRLGWEPRDGFSQRGLYTFASTGDGTEVSFEVSFDLPGGLAGRTLGKVIEPVAKQNVGKTLKNLKREVEAGG
jgi:uncharacterized membrane protein